MPEREIQEEAEMRTVRGARRSLAVLFFATSALAALCFAAAALAQPVAAMPERVVLLHGLARSASSMSSLETALRDAGFEVHNIDYSSREGTPEELLAVVQEAVETCCAGHGGRLHFVTHSLGGILVRAYLARQRPPELGRVVLLAPPNRGSEIVDAVGQTGWFSEIFGPTGQALGTEPDSLPNRLPPPDYPLGIIAGDRSLNPIGSWLIPGPDDGAVSVENSKLPGAADFLVVDATHTFIMNDAEAIRHTIHFLKTGAFDSPPPRSNAVQSW